MHKFFCDLCESECPGTTTRQWQHVSGELGFEVIILQGENPTNGMHLCDLCVIKILWKIVEDNTDLGLRDLRAELKSKESKLNRREKNISFKENALAELDQQLKAKEKVINDREAKLFQSKDVVIATQAEVFRQKQADLVRQAEARGRQQVIDEMDAQRRFKEGRS